MREGVGEGGRLREGVGEGGRVREGVGEGGRVREGVGEGGNSRSCRLWYRETDVGFNEVVGDDDDIRGIPHCRCRATNV